MPDVNADRIRNELRRNLTKYIEHRGSNKTGGYYIKGWFHIIEIDGETYEWKTKWILKPDFLDKELWAPISSCSIKENVCIHT